MVPYPFFAGVAAGAAFAGTFAGFACAGGAVTGCGGVISADNWKLNVCTALALVVLLRFLDFHLLEVSRTLQSRNEIRYRVDGSRRTLNRQGRSLPRHGRQPKIFGSRNRVRHHVQQVLPAGTVTLQLFDGGNSLLQNLFLLIESLYLLLDAFEIGLLRLQRLDLAVLGIELLLPGVIKETKNKNSRERGQRR